MRGDGWRVKGGGREGEGIRMDGRERGKEGGGVK